MLLQIAVIITHLRQNIFARGVGGTFHGGLTTTLFSALLIIGVLRSGRPTITREAST